MSDLGIRVWGYCSHQKLPTLEPQRSAFRHWCIFSSNVRRILLFLSGGSIQCIRCGEEQLSDNKQIISVGGEDALLGLGVYALFSS